MDYPPIPEYADVTPDTAPDLPTGTAPGRAPEGATPRLADRLSALVGQAASRQEDSVSAERLVAAIAARVDAATAELRERIAVVEAGQSARMSELEALVGERLKAIEAAVGSPVDDGVKSHVDEVGGALVIRLDEVLAGVTAHVDATSSSAAVSDARHQLAVQLEDARAQLATQVDEVRVSLAGQAEESRAALTALVAGFDETIRGHVGDLAAGVLELGGTTAITREDVDAAVSVIRDDVQGLPALLDGVAQAAQLDGVTATTTALRQEVDELRSEFAGLQSAIERRVDDAALALAETLVAVITSLPISAPAPTIDYDFSTPDYPAEPEAGHDGDWPAADPAEELAEHTLAEHTQVGEISLVEESHEQAEGVEEGGAALTDGEPGAGDLESAFASHSDDDGSTRRKGLFRR